MQSSVHLSRCPTPAMLLISRVLWCCFVMMQGEHGTGRNMAPFVELEWGAKALQVMKEIKRMFDPENLLNPGVILNEVCASHGMPDCVVKCT